MSNGRRGTGAAAAQHGSAALHCAKVPRTAGGALSARRTHTGAACYRSTNRRGGGNCSHGAAMPAGNTAKCATRSVPTNADAAGIAHGHAC